MAATIAAPATDPIFPSTSITGFVRIESGWFKLKSPTPIIKAKTIPSIAKQIVTITALM